MDSYYTNNSAINFSVDLPDSYPIDYYSIYYDGDIDNVKKAWIREPHFIPLVALYGFVFLFGIVGNGLVLFAIIGSNKCRNITFSFMLSLALADLLFVLICVPHDTMGMVMGHWDGGRTFCKIAGFIEMLSAVASILNLTAISIERYYVIVNPLQSRKRCTLGRTRRVLLMVWAASAVLSSPAYLVRDIAVTTFYNNDTSVKTSLCGDHADDDRILLYFAIYQLIVMFILPTVVMTFCYSVVVYALWISRKKLVSLTKSGRPLLSSVLTTSVNGKYVSGTRPPSPTLSTHSRTFRCTAKDHRNSALKARKQIVKMLITVVLMFLLCWGPKLILQILKRLQLECMYYKEVFNAQIALYCLAYIQSCVNPVIYGLMCRNFRVSLKNACRRCPGWTARHRNRSQYLSEYEMDSRHSSDSSRLRRSQFESLKTIASQNALCFEPSIKML